MAKYLYTYTHGASQEREPLHYTYNSIQYTSSAYSVRRLRSEVTCDVYCVKLGLNENPMLASLPFEAPPVRWHHPRFVQRFFNLNCGPWETPPPS